MSNENEMEEWVKEMMQDKRAKQFVLEASMAIAAQLSERSLLAAIDMSEKISEMVEWSHQLSKIYAEGVAGEALGEMAKREEGKETVSE